MAVIGIKRSNFSNLCDALVRANSALDNAQNLSRAARDSLSMEVRSRENIDEMIASGIQKTGSQGQKIRTLTELTRLSADELGEKDSACAKKTKGAMASVQMASVPKNNSSVLSTVASLKHHFIISNIIKNIPIIPGIPFSINNISLLLKSFRDACLKEYKDVGGKTVYFPSDALYEAYMQKQGNLYLKNQNGEYEVFDSKAEYDSRKQQLNVAEIENRYANIIGLKNNEYYLRCDLLIKAELSAAGITDSAGELINGYRKEKVAVGNDPKKTFLDLVSSMGDPAENIKLDYKQWYSNVHRMLITKIENGKVYYVDNTTSAVSESKKKSNNESCYEVLVLDLQSFTDKYFGDQCVCNGISYYTNK